MKEDKKPMRRRFQRTVASESSKTSLLRLESWVWSLLIRPCQLKEVTERLTNLKDEPAEEE